MEELARQILEAVSKAAGVTVPELRSRSRTPRLVAARYIAANLLSREPYCLSQEEIAMIIARDRTTVSYGVGLHTAHIRSWALYRRIFSHVEKSLISPPDALITISHFCEG